MGCWHQRTRTMGRSYLLHPSPDRQHGDVYIATGYGLEGAVPDAIANRIIDFDMIPYFRELDYYGGLETASNTLMELTRGEYTADEYLQRNQTAEGSVIPADYIYSVLSSSPGLSPQQVGKTIFPRAQGPLVAGAVSLQADQANHIPAVSKASAPVVVDLAVVDLAAVDLAAVVVAASVVAVPAGGGDEGLSVSVSVSVKWCECAHFKRCK